MKTKLLLVVVILFALSTYGQIYMYGTTYEGGANNLGTIYRVDQNGQNFQKLYDFTTATGGKPFGGLTLANGKLYGFTSENGPASSPGATLGLGSFFSFDPLTNNFTVIQSVDDASEFGNNFYHSPLLTNDGNLYFASYDYGLNGVSSVLSKYNPQTNILTVLDTLPNGFCGRIKDKLIQASNGHIYFVTSSGGANSKGTISRWNMTTNQLEILFDSPTGPGTMGFNGSTNQLLEGSDGLLYGVSHDGGTGNTGVFYKIGLDGSGYSGIFSFTSAVANEGFYPFGGLIERNGVIYGTTSEGTIGGQNSGTIFSFTLANSSFQFVYVLDLEGYRPKGTFVQSPNGRFYITTSGEPGLNNGNLIEFNPVNNSVTTRHSFVSTTDGKKPYYDGLCLVDFSVLSINETSLPDNIIKIYPNPVNEIINVDIDKSYVIESIKILDMRGSVLFKNNTITNNSKVNTSFLTSGSYLLFIQTNKGSITKKILKE